MSKEQLKKIFENDKSTWEAKTMHEFIDILAEFIDILAMKDDFLVVKAKLPEADGTTLVTLPNEFSNSEIISYKAKNVNGAWISGVGTSSLYDWKVTAQIYGRNLNIKNGLKDLEGNDVQLLIAKTDNFETI